MDPRPNAKGMESPFALYGTFDPSSTGQKNMGQPENSSTKVVRRNVSMQIKSLLAPELNQSTVRGDHHQVQLTPQNGQIMDVLGYKPIPLRSNSQLYSKIVILTRAYDKLNRSKSVSQKEGQFATHEVSY